MMKVPPDKRTSDLEISDAILSKDDLIQVLELDSLVYPINYQSSIEEVLSRFEKCNECFITARLQNMIIGYICYFPISMELFERFKDGRFINDSEIKAEDVLSFPNAEGILYIISVVVHPEFHNSNVVREIMKAFENKLTYLIANYRINEVIASAITFKGESTLRKSEFEYLESNQSKDVKLMRRIL